MNAGSSESKTVGFVLWGEIVERGAAFIDGAVKWYTEEPETVFPTVEGLLRALIQAALKRGSKGESDNGNVYGPVTIKKVVVRTVTSTTRDYAAV